MEEVLKVKKVHGLTGRIKVKRDVCIVCNKEFYCAPCYKKRSPNSGKFCSSKCRGIKQSEKYALSYKELREQREEEKIIKDKLIQERKEYLIRKKQKNNNCLYCNEKCLKKYCNKDCHNKYRATHLKDNTVMNICKNCKKEFPIKQFRIRVGEGIYCSISCSRQSYMKSGKFRNTGNAIGGKREDLNNMYFRSRWEANYARYLNFLVKNKEILKWEYEVDTFRFTEIKRGIQSYTPDFKIFDFKGGFKYIEVKGYMSPQSVTKLKRMAKYYPQYEIEIFGEKKYRELSKKMATIIPNWEINPIKKI